MMLLVHSFVFSLCILLHKFVLLFPIFSMLGDQCISGIQLIFIVLVIYVIYCLLYIYIFCFLCIVSIITLSLSIPCDYNYTYGGKGSVTIIKEDGKLG